MEGGVGCERTLVLAGAASESVMAAAAELSRPTIGDRSLERSCSPSLSREIVCEVFRSLHNLAGQNFSGKRRKVQPPQQNYSLAELDEKISALKQALLRKSRETESMGTRHLP